MPLLRLAELPLELLDCVAENADLGSSLSLCQTDRRTHGVCLRWIYRHLLLEDPVRAIGCLKTVISNAEAAHAVRILVIRVEKLSLLAAFYRLLTTALRLATNLELLDIYTRPELFAAARGIHFSRLRRVSIPFCADIIPFLQLHQNLVELSVDPVPNASVATWRASLHPILLPHLEVFSGPEIVAQSVLRGSRTTHIIVFWNPQLHQGFTDFFLAIDNCPKKFQNVHNILTFWDPLLLGAIARYTPRLMSLGVRNVSSFHEPTEMDEFISGVDAMLRTLPELCSLSIVANAVPASSTTADLDREFEIVRRWGDVVPKLCRCVFPSTTEWFRGDTGVWCPLNMADKDARFQWFLTTIISTPALPAEYVQFLETSGPDGRNMVAVLRATFARDGTAGIARVLAAV
ncbi:hypothetical protein B0H15DRAFT_995571 [Mycena belliarum]|uniref:F-box domain-containing protein n=1 Tax=Mycena belliarum TaxID=1033014 RepID=A0AAD6UF01_9AGAR|nr:hypothetical protein B0H15DRAFT_995571 [Mycena belliae]